MENIHCSKDEEDEEEKLKSVKDGMWATLASRCSPRELQEYCDKSLKMKKAKKEKGKEEDAESEGKKRLSNSLVTRYQGSLITERKYQSIRNYQKSKSVVDEYLLLPVKKLNMRIARIQNAQLKVSPLPNIRGLSRSLKELCIRIAMLYLDIIPTELKWFDDKEGNFILSAGADGAPMPQYEGEESGTAFLISMINVTHRVASPKHNFILFGGHCSETNEEFIHLLKKFSSDMTDLEKQVFTIKERRVTFSLGLLTGDQKWIAVAGGELNSAATYPSSFGDVHKKEFSEMDGDIGMEESSRWHPWEYDKRLSDVKSINIPKSTSKRSQFTKALAEKKSRQVL